MLVLSAGAQDVIVCKDSKRIDAVIMEVSLGEVKYKKQGSPNGPTFVLPLSEVNTILYADGEVWTNQGQASGTKNADNTNTGNVGENTGGSKFKLQFNPTPTGEKHIFGLTVGYTNKTRRERDDDESYTASWLYGKENKKTPGMMIGFTITPEFKYGIGIQTGLTYELYRETTKGHGYKASWTEHTFNVPLRLQYRYEIIRDLSVFLYTGPAFEVALNPIHKYTEGGETEINKSEYGKETGYRRFQMYWGFGGGVQWKYLQLRMGGDWGITHCRMEEYHNDAFYTRNKPFHIVLSYLF